MVNNVRISNFMHRMLATKAKVPINRCRGALKESPGLWLVFGNFGVCVMEICDCYNPVIDPEIRHPMEQRNGSISKDGACVPQPRKRQSDTDVGGQDEMPLFRPKK